MKIAVLDDGQLRDPQGHMGSIAIPVEDVSPDEMRKCAAALHKG
jgi:hypothetical protein